MSKPKRGTTPDPAVALRAADAFRALSQRFLESVGRDSTTAHERAHRDIGGMIASATNLALSVELYLKALFILIGSKVPQTHDLLDLFGRLPDDLKESIIRHYNALGKPPGEDIDTLEVQVSVGPFRNDQITEIERKESGDIEDKSLAAVLRRSKDAFETWRYLHERGDPNAISSFNYEFHYLGNAAEAVRTHVHDGLTQVQRSERK